MNIYQIIQRFYSLYENQDTIGEIVIRIEYGWMIAVEYKVECFNIYTIKRTKTFSHFTKYQL